MKSRTTSRDHLFGALLCVGYVVLLLATSADLAMSRDESFYVVAAQDYAGWIELLFSDSSAAMEQGAIDQAWDFNHEHPGLAKGLFALSWLAHQKWEIFSTDSDAFRFPGMLSGGLLLWLLYIFGAQVFSRTAGVFAALSFATIPRIFYHAHLDCFDIPIVLALTLVIYCYWRSLQDWRWAIWTGIAFGLALATKHNSWVLPGILLIHFGWMSLGARRAGRHSPRPWWLVAIVTLGPPIFLVTWPWLWNETLPRIGFYVRFHLQHEYYNMAYFGENHFLPPFPVSFPFVMTLFTVTLTFIALSLYGFGQRLPHLVPRWVGRRFPRVAAWQQGLPIDKLYTDVLLFGVMFAPIFVIALPSTPIFGGTKHWFPAYPFMAMYAGHGFALIAKRISEVLSVRTQARVATVGLGALLLAPGALETAHAHPFGLSHYTVAAGGVPGAADYGMNRQFWGFTTGSLADWLKETMPDGGSVWLCDMTWHAWQMMQRDGVLPQNLRASPSFTRADYVLVHHEHHFAEVDFQAWVAFGSPKPVKVLTYDGVPIITVYENPRRRSRR